MMRFFIIFIFASPLVWAINDLTIEPSPGMPLVTIEGQTAIDLRNLPLGNVMQFDVYLRDIDFTLAGLELRIYFPTGMTEIDSRQQHWQNNFGAVFKPGPAFANGQALVLPADEDGNRLVPSATISYMVGLVFKDSLARWEGTPINPHPGGLLGSIGLSFNLDNEDSCDSKIESVRIGLGPLFCDGEFDYFSNENGDRVALTSTIPLDIHGQKGLAAYMGNPDASIRADANDDGQRNALDALSAANCALNGPDDPACVGGTYWGQYPDRFDQVFDFNCDGIVNSLDALGNARLALGQVFDDPIGSASRMSIPDFSGDTGVMAVRGYYRPNPRLKPSLRQENRDWELHWDAQGDKVDVLLISKNPGIDAPFPEIFWPNAGGPDEVRPIHATHMNAAGQRRDYRTQ